MNATWTPDRERTLREMWSRGCSASHIGKEIGVSRGAVLGFIYRNQIERDTPIPDDEENLGHRSIWDLPDDERRAAFARVAAYGARQRLAAIMEDAA